MMSDYYVTVVGGGVVGNYVAHELSKRIDRDEIVHVDKSPSFPGENQSSRLSGVDHSGIYYDKTHSPLKAELCVDGNEDLRIFCQNYSLPFYQVGKFIVAKDEGEDVTLDVLIERGNENGVPGLQKITGGELTEREPNVRGYSAIWVPTAGIFEPTSILKKLKTLANLGNNFLINTEVTNISPRDDEFIVTINRAGVEEEFSTKYVVNAAGLDSDNLARMVNPEFPLKVFRVRGEFAKFYQSRDELVVSSNIYPAPTYFEKPDGTKQLTVGVHLTPTFVYDETSFGLSDEVIVGPFNRKRGDELEECGMSGDLAPTEEFYDKIVDMFPNINLDDLHLHQVGIQAFCEGSSDFHIAPDEKYKGMINSVGVSSPGFSSAPAIAKLIDTFIE